jgi:hypothetical protein
MIEVCVVGELNLDLILYGLPKDLVPDREHLASDMAFTLGSSSAIFAHNLCALGTRVGSYRESVVIRWEPWPQSGCPQWASTSAG